MEVAWAWASPVPAIRRELRRNKQRARRSIGEGFALGNRTQVEYPKRRARLSLSARSGQTDRAPQRVTNRQRPASSQRGRRGDIPPITAAHGRPLETSHRHRRQLLQGIAASSLQGWYKRHLGIDVQAWGGAAFDWTDAEGKPVAGTTAWLIDPQESDHFASSSAPFMVNYRVEGLQGNKIERWRPTLRQ